MHIDVTGRRLEITDALREYVFQKFARLERHFDKINHVHAILSVEKNTQKAEASIHLAGGEIFADAKADDMYAAIDALTDKLVRQLEKHKEKVRHSNH